MKKLVKTYDFVPASRKILLDNDFLKKHPGIRTESFLLITNVTTGDMIYIFNEPELGGVFEHEHLTLDYDTTSMSSTDKLQIFVDVSPALHIQGEDGTHRGGHTQRPAHVTMDDFTGTFRAILKELKKMNMHLESMTDLNLTNRDIDGDR